MNSFLSDVNATEPNLAIFNQFQDLQFFPMPSKSAPPNDANDGNDSISLLFYRLRLMQRGCIGYTCSSFNVTGA